MEKSKKQSSKSKLHSEKINCGLCNYEASELESLETHMNTCEIYKCSDCKKIVKTLADMKNHLRNEHNGKVVYITHSKMDRKCADYFNSKDYSSKELFCKK